MTRLMSPTRPALRISGLRRLSLAAMAVTVASLLAGAAPALAQAPWWQVSSEVVPTHLPPGAEGEIVIAVSNLGDAPVNAAENPVTITDKLPAGLTAVAISGTVKNGTEVKCPTEEPPVAPLSCTFEGTVYPYERLAVTIKVKVDEPHGTATSLPDQVVVTGGGVGRVESVQYVTVNGEPAAFGMQVYELQPFNEDGTSATQAGSHPFQLTTQLTLNQAVRHPVALPKDVSFRLPSGLIGNPNAVAECNEVDFAAVVEETNLCPPSSVVGVATVVAYEPIAQEVVKTVPVFNLVPAQGEPARFGFEVIGKIPVIIDTSVRSGGDYAVVASVKNATQTAGLLSSQVTLWGVPGDPRHNSSRGWECVAGETFAKQVGKACPATSQEPEVPFLRSPTSCAANPADEPVVSSVEADSWTQPGTFVSSEYSWMTGEGELLGFNGCAALPFTPSLSVAPEEHAAATPTGLSVDVKVPQQALLEPGALAQADVRDTTVTLPEGVALSPSAANGLEGCSEAQIGFTGFNPKSETNEFTSSTPSCPDGSKVGSVKIKTPLLSHELEGWVYLASPAPNGETGQNPFNSLVALYIVAEDPVSGVLVKLAGEGQIDEGTLQVSTTFRNAPQVPFEDLKLDLFGGPRASVSTPPLCGAYPTSAVFTPWSGTEPVSVLSPPADFTINTGVGGSGCPSALAFSPGFLAQSTSAQAGAFTGFSLELSRPDGDQALKGLSMHLPAGVAAMLSSVALCTEAQANTNTCPADSEVGQATAVAGLGPEPYTEAGGKVFITGPYHGAPFGLAIVTPAVAGPFDLGTVTVLSRLLIEPTNASVTIVSDPLPTQLRGIPLQLKRVLVNVDRPGFEFNPTNCSPMKIEGTIIGDQGASEAVSSPFQVENCQSLPFKPKLTASTKGQGSKGDGASFAVTVRSAGLGQANIAKVRLQLPKALPARLSTLQKACTERAFNANPASCPEGSVIGDATIHTPVLASPLRGPAYLVSHGDAAFPDVEFVLQGEGITLLLDGKTQIKNQITYSKFESAPDAPFTVFETVLPMGQHSALTTNLPEKAKFNLCSSNLSMPTEIVGQNGAVINQNTKIALQGCNKVGSAKKSLSRAQLLKRALASCRKQHRHSKAERSACERKARKAYGAKKTVHKATRTGSHRKPA
jgi:uncharacterized repeat protein (TIGR01451 family)